MRVPVRFVVVGVAIILAAGLVSPVFVSAQNAEMTGGYKIGVVDRKEVFDNLEQQQRQYQELQREMEEMQAEIDRLSERIEADQQRLRLEGPTMSPADREELEARLSSNLNQYQAEFQRLQLEVDTRFSRLVRRIREQIDEAVQEIGAQENFHLILEGDPRSQSGVLYYSSTIDLTSRVLTALENR